MPHRNTVLLLFALLFHQSTTAASNNSSWISAKPLAETNWRRDPTVSVVQDSNYFGDYHDATQQHTENSKNASQAPAVAPKNASATEITINKIDIFSGEPLPTERIRVNPGTLRNYCKINVQGAVKGDTNATARWNIATFFMVCDGPDKVRVKIHPALGRFVKDFTGMDTAMGGGCVGVWVCRPRRVPSTKSAVEVVMCHIPTGVQVVRNQDPIPSALLSFVGPQEVAIYNSTMLFMRDVDPTLAFIKLENGMNATMTRMNIFDNTGGCIQAWGGVGCRIVAVWKSNGQKVLGTKQ